MPNLDLVALTIDFESEADGPGDCAGETLQTYVQADGETVTIKFPNGVVIHCDQEPIAAVTRLGRCSGLGCADGGLSPVED